MPTRREIRIWTEAIDEIVARDGISREAANRNLLNLLESHAKDPVGTALYVWNTIIGIITERDGISREEANAQFQHYIEVGSWAAAIRELRQTFPDLTEEQANENLLNLIDAATTDPEGTAAFVWSNVIRLIMVRDRISESEANENFWNLINNLEAAKEDEDQ